MLSLHLVTSESVATQSPMDKLKNFIAAQKNASLAALTQSIDGLEANELVPCTCGVFLSNQFVKGSPEQPKGLAALLQEQDSHYPCNAIGVKQCTNKCLDSIVKHLPNSPSIICGSIDRDCYKERAYLFIQNCDALWINTNLSAGREYCCKDSLPYKCPIV